MGWELPEPQMILRSFKGVRGRGQDKGRREERRDGDRERKRKKIQARVTQKTTTTKSLHKPG